MDRIKVESNFRIKQNALPPVNVNKLHLDNPLFTPVQQQQYNQHIQQQFSSGLHDRTSMSWMEQSSMNQTHLMNRTYLNNTQGSLNYTANKTLKSIDANSLKTPRRVMKNLNKSLTPTVWQTQSSGFFNYQPPKTQEELKDEQMETKFLNKINDSFEIKVDDRDPKDPVGEDAENEYYNHYKRLKKVEQQNLYFTDINDSAYTCMLRQSEKSLITPQTLGLIKKEGLEDILTLDNRKIGDSYAQMLSQGVKKTPSINKFHLKNNRISQKGSENLIKQITKQARILDLSYNEIGRMGCQHLAYSLISKQGRLQYLNLEGNKIGSNSAILLLESCINNKSLTYLNLSKNFLNDSIKEYVHKLLIEHPLLEELYFRWNNLKAPFGNRLFQALTENKIGPLKVLDVSCNNLGQGGECANDIAEFFGANEEVIHLDLSYNKFSLNDSIIISAGLEPNKTIYGIHFSGNYGYIDSRGFLIIEDKQSNIEINSDLTKHKIDGCKVVTNKMFRHHRDIDLRDCCWICQGWEEREFRWTKKTSGEGDTDPLFIHFNFENFNPCYFGKQSGDVLEYNRMVPPGELDYFFTTGTGDEQAYALDHPSQAIQFKQIFHKIKMPDDEIKDVELEKFNNLNIEKCMRLMIKYSPTIEIKPRTRDPVYIPDKKKKTRKRWTFPISLMYKWKPDTDKLLQECFEFDWNLSRVHKVVKDQEELEKVKDFFRERYQYFRNTYKHWACINPVGDIWAIQTASFFEIINQTNLIDGKLVKDADINIKWTSVISGGDKGNPRNPVQAVNRHQFMEIWVRIAEEKYIFKYKTTQSYIEALQQIWAEHLEKLFTSYNQQKWREERYWNEDCDYCLKHYKRIIEYVKPGQAAFMCLDEVLSIITQSNLPQEDNFGSGVYLVSFNQSMMTQVDEINQDRIFQMSMVEFYEALARIAEEASLIPMLGEYGVYPDDGSDWTLERRKAEPLGHKIEALIFRLYDCCTDTAFKLNIPRPDRSFFWKDPEESDFDYVD